MTGGAWVLLEAPEGLTVLGPGEEQAGCRRPDAGPLPEGALLGSGLVGRGSHAGLHSQEPCGGGQVPLVNLANCLPEESPEPGGGWPGAWLWGAALRALHLFLCYSH